MLNRKVKSKLLPLNRRLTSWLTTLKSTSKGMNRYVFSRVKHLTGATKQKHAHRVIKNPG